MNRSLARHAHIARLRSQRVPAPDREVMKIIDEVTGSGLVEEIEPLVSRRTGSPCTLPIKALLVGMCLTAARDGGVILFTRVTNLLYFALSDEMRQQLGLGHYPDHDRGFESAYAVVRRRIHSVLDAIDPSPLPKNHRLARRHAEKLLAQADSAELARRRTLMLRVTNMILAMSLREVLPLLEGHWDGSVCVDATVIGTYAKGLASDGPVTSTDPDAAWYVRTAKHKDPLALDDLAPRPAGQERRQAPEEGGPHQEAPVRLRRLPRHRPRPRPRRPPLARRLGEPRRRPCPGHRLLGRKAQPPPRAGGRRGSPADR
ncbi:hypothetical protein [Streptomyces sp900105755]|uniref:Transposase n=1 Tax=Streptomyces sp. 900105755 TaxID=3154389 RepID=A0ABV1TDP1_9ACTN